MLQFFFVVVIVVRQYGLYLHGVLNRMQEACVETLDLVPFTLKYPMTHLTIFFSFRFPINKMEESLLHLLLQGGGIPWTSTMLHTYMSTHVHSHTNESL